MFTILWDNDGVLVDTEGFYFRACRSVLRNVGIDLTADQFRDISLRRGVSVFTLAAEQGETFNSRVETAGHVVCRPVVNTRCVCFNAKE